jgi:acyl dehydratase
VRNAKLAINYGLDKVRFLAPVVAGSRIRVRSELVNAVKVGDDTLNLTARNTVEVEGSQKPAAVADLIARYVF